MLGLSALYLLVAYVVLPRYWQHHDTQRPNFADIARVTRSGDGVPGDPLNIAIFGSEDRLRGAMKASGWYVADQLDVHDSLRIAADTLLHR